jgi:parvulin-like peptidyl-prolyl isomerase
MTSSSGPGRIRGTLASRLPSLSRGSSGGRYSDPEERFQRNVTLGFVGLIALVAVMVVGALAYGFWESNFRSVASVAGTGIRQADWEDRVRLEDFRLSRAEGRVRTALAAGTVSEAVANARLSAIAAAQQGLGAGSLERLIDLTYQAQLAEGEGLTLAPEDLEAALALEGARPEARRVQAVIIAPAGAAEGLPSTPESRRTAFEQAQAAVVALESGRPFEEVVAEFGTQATADGGDLGFVERSDLDDVAWAEALFGLEVGEVTDLIAADDGSYRIGRVSEILPEEPDAAYLGDADRGVGAEVHRRNVRLERLSAKLEERVAAEAVAGEVPQVRLAEILIEGDTFSDPETDEGSVRASHILYSPADDPSAQGVEDDGPEWQAAQEEAEAAAAALGAITDPVARAEAFAQRAREESDDPTAAIGGGDLGYFTRTTMVPEFAAPLFDDPLLQPGQIVGPVRTDFGWHVIQFTDRRAPLAERVAAVEAALEAPGADFASVARERSDGAEAPAGGETGWHTLDELDEEVVQALAGLAPGERSEPVETADGFVIYQKVEEASRPLDPAQAARVREHAFADWYEERRFEAEEQGLISQDESVLGLGA